jgi:uncharacterized membrane protein required for colicin V production
MSWIDILLMLILMGGLAAGYVQGLWRQAMSLGAIIAAIILATYLQVFLTAWFGFISPGTPFVIRGSAAFLILVSLITIVLDLVARRVFPETRLPVLGIFDRLGGIVIGFFTICVQVSVAVLVFKFLARLSWPIGDSIRLVLVNGIESSVLLPAFYGMLAAFVRIVGLLLPEGAPRFLDLL